MIEHYNAFISYKHGELDNKIAEHVQKALEHFNIPEPIKKKTGKKRIHRIFRDKSELEITSDLSDTIYEALDDADYLIVICSKATRESIWVKREIQHFLTNHPRNRVLTVLTEGEPNEVIPEELLYEMKTIRDANGNLHTIREPLEPLSCDYRLPIRQADKEELPRLAAPIIGCSYDELMKRRRSYMVRKLVLSFALIFTLMLALGVYLFFLYKQIDQNYKQALISQSRYLAYESETLMDEKHRTEALLLALEALPSEGNNRPIVGDAVHALTKATLAYQPLSGLSINPQFTYYLSTEIKNYEISPDGTLLAVAANNSMVRIWDVEEHQVLQTLQISKSEISDCHFFDDDMLIVLTKDQLLALDPRTGKQTWSFTYDSAFSSVSGIMCSDTSIFIKTYNNIFLEINPKNGKLIAEHKDTNNVMSTVLIPVDPLSPDGTKILFYDPSTDACCVGFYDLTTDTIVKQDIENEDCRTVCWYDDNTVLAATVLPNQRYLDSTSEFEILNSIEMNIHCYHLTVGQTLSLTENWTAPYIAKGTLFKSGFQPLPSIQSVAYYRGNTCQIIDIESGEVTHLYDIESPIVYINDNDNDGTPLLITTNGGLATPVTSVGKDTISIQYPFCDDISEVQVRDGIYLKASDSRSIIFFSLYECDNDFTKLKGDKTFTSFMGKSSYMSGDTLAIIYKNENDEESLHIINMKSNKIVESIDLDSVVSDKIADASHSIIGIENDMIYVSSTGDGKSVLIMFDAQSGDLEDCVETGGNDYSCNLYTLITDGKIPFIGRNNQKTTLHLYDCAEDDFETYDLSCLGDDMILFQYIEILSDRNLLHLVEVYGSNEKKEYFVDLDEEELYEFEFPENWNYSVASASCPEKGLVAFTDRSQIVVFNKDDEATTIFCEGKSCVDLNYLQVGKQYYLIAAFGDGNLYRYDADSLELLGTTNTTSIGSDAMQGTHYATLRRYELSPDGKELYLQISNSLSIIDMESWSEMAYIPQCFGHYTAQDRFYCESYLNISEISVGYFPHYTLEELIEKARELCGDAELSEEMKSKYGI